MPDDALKTSFPPSVDAETRILLLGSLPGARSLAISEYYAHPSNGFWWLMGEVLGEPELSRLFYQEKLDRLRAHHVGLWDVIASARRAGSLDSAIREATDQDLVEFAAGLPNLRAIGFNGGAASTRGRRQLAGQADRWKLIDLPSSSGAYARMPRATKLVLWRSIGKHLA